MTENENEVLEELKPHLGNTPITPAHGIAAIDDPLPPNETDSNTD